MRSRFFDSAGIVIPAILLAAVAALLLLHRADPSGRGSGMIQLTFDGASVSNLFPVASPDGRYVAFQRCSDPLISKSMDGQAQYSFKEDESNWDIFRINVDGTSLVRLTDSPHVDDAPAWSPDARTIAYRSFDGGRFALFLMDANGGHKRQLLSDPNADAKTPSFAPAGDKVVFYANRAGRQDWNLFTVNVADGQVKQLTYGTYEDKHPQFTPDGKEVIFHSDRAQATLKSRTHHKLMKIFARDLASGESKSLSDANELRDDRHAFPSPDGRFIVYHSLLYAPDPKQSNQFKKASEDIFIMTRDGRKRINVTHGDHRYFKHPSWSADGMGVYCVFKEKTAGGAAIQGQSGGWNLCYLPVAGIIKQLE
jgi:Tol biopolymer transport system component